MNKVAVTGCSFSSYTGVDKVYGDWIAERLNIEYLHLARGIGSNHRGIYASTKAITSGALSEGDVLVFQITDPHRKILSSFEPIKYIDMPGQAEKWPTPFGDAWTTDYKAGSSQWQGSDPVGKRNRRLYMTMELSCVNNAFETDQLVMQLILLDALCKTRGITLIPVATRYVSYIDWREHNQNDIAGSLSDILPADLVERLFNETDHIIRGSSEEPSVHDLGFRDPSSPFGDDQNYDNSHLSAEGHKVIGISLASHIQMVVDKAQ